MFVSQLTAYLDSIIVDHQCESRCNRSTTNQISCTLQVFEK